MSLAREMPELFTGELEREPVERDPYLREWEQNPYLPPHVTTRDIERNC